MESTVLQVLLINQQQIQLSEQLLQKLLLIWELRHLPINELPQILQTHAITTMTLQITFHHIVSEDLMEVVGIDLCLEALSYQTTSLIEKQLMLLISAIH